MNNATYTPNTKRIQSAQRNTMKASYIYTLATAIALLFICMSADMLAQSTITYTYDDAGRLTKVMYADSSTIEYTYDDNGNILTMKGTPAEQNEAPTATSATITTDEDMAGTAVPDVDDPNDGDTHTFTILTQPSNGTAAVTNNELEYTPDADYNGSDSFTYRATDNGGLSVDGTCDVTVTPVNDDPIAVDDNLTVFEDTPGTIDPRTNDSDIDGDGLTVQSITQPSNGSAQIILDDHIEYTPNAGYTGQDSFEYTIEDGNGGSATATITVTVEEQTGLPVAVDDNAATDEDMPVTIDVLSNDNDGSGTGLTITATTDPSNGTVQIAGQEIEYTPDPDYNGSDSFDYTIEDGNSESSTATVTVTVNPVNDEPGDFMRTMPADNSTQANPVTFGWTESVDPESDPVTYVLIFSVDGNNRQITTIQQSVTFDFATLGLSDGQYTVMWILSATDDVDTVASTDGEGQFTLDITTGIEVVETSANTISLSQNYPNPVQQSGATTIPFSLENGTHVSLVIHDALGREAARLIDGYRSSGEQSITIPANTLNPGVYIYRLTANGAVLEKGLQVVR